MTNATKHAYPNGSGTISIETTIKGDQLQLLVSDNGIGLPDGFDIDENPSRSLGARMIVSLARQLHGILNVTGGHGTSVSIAMPIKWLQGE